ncbi:MAG: ATP-binding protein [Balneolaceae bacterium]
MFSFESNIVGCKLFKWVAVKKILGFLLISFLGVNSYILSAKTHIGHEEEDSITLLQVSLKSDSARVDLLITKIREFRFSNPELSKIYADTALELSIELNLKPREAEVLNQLGIIASVQGDSPTALEFFLDVLRVREEIGDISGIARIQNNLGILYKNLEDYDRSLQFHLKSLENKKILNDSLGIARSLNNIGEIYQQQRNTNEAKLYFEESLTYMLILDYREGLAAVYNNLGEVFKLEEELGRAIEFHELSLEIEKELGNASGIGFSYLNIASLFLQVNQPDVAIANYLESINYFVQVNDLNGLRNAYKDIATTYADLENFQKSLEYFQLYTSIKDSIVTVESNQKIAELQAEFETEKQKQEINLLNEKALLQEIQLQQEERTRNQLLIILLLLATIGVTLYLSNRSKQKINALLIQEKKKVEEAAMLKTQFLSVMSHEIRTPMNAVVGMTNLLVNENPREDQKQYLDTLLFSSNNLLSIVNDVLDYSKVEAGKIVLENIDFRLLYLLSNIHQSFYNQSVQKEVYLKFEHDEKIPEVIKGDPTRLTQILNNLISNALKFTEKGSVIVQVSLEDQTEKDALVNFKVSDTGIGIPPEKLEIIFESFIQADTEVHRKYGGTGLGLTITKKLVELHKSSIKVVSSLGKGTSFSFSLRFEKGDAKNTLIASKGNIDLLDKFVDKNVLVVEDNPVNVQVIKLYLKKWGIEPVISLNGEYALEFYKEQNFDIIFMDLHMPVMDGYKATEKIRELEKGKTKKTPIIALTASNVFEEHSRAIEAGVDEIIPKPFNPDQLHNAIARFTSS